MDVLIGLVILSVICAAPWIVWGGLIAQHRGRHPIYGVLLGLLGPLGVALAWLLPPDEPTVWERRLRWENSRGMHADAPIGGVRRVA